MITIETTHPGLTVHEVLGGTEQDLEDLLMIHRELFPKFSSYIPFMYERAQEPPDTDPRFIEHWWLARIDGEPAGIRYFKYVPRRHCGLSLGIAILKPFRHLTFGDHYGRFSRMLTLTSLEQLEADARSMDQPVPVGIFAEVEAYLLPRYDEFDFIRLPIDYQEPSSTPEASEARGDSTDETLSFRSIAVGVFKLANTQFDPFNRSVMKDMTLAFLIDHYGLPDDHPVVQRALESIDTMPEAKDE